MPSYTTNLNLTKPTVGGDTNVWGGYVNGNSDTLDGIFADAGNGTSVGLNVGSGKTLTVAGTLTSTGSASFSNIDVNGGAIDGTPIGASSTSTGAFTTVSASTSLSTSNATNGNVNISGNSSYAVDIFKPAGGEMLNIHSDGGSNGAFIRMDTDNSLPIKFGMDENNGHFQYFYNGVKKFEAKNNGDILLVGDGAKIFLNSPNGTEYYLSVDNSGNLVVTNV
jgi:hypothetical protein